MQFGITGTLGLMLLLGGIAQCIQLIFGIDIPIFQAFFAVGLIYAGIVLIASHRRTLKTNTRSQDHHVLMGHDHLRLSSTDTTPKHLVAVGAIAVIDLSTLQPAQSDIHIYVQSVASHLTLVLHPHVPIAVEAQAAMAYCGLPNGHSVTFGTLVYRAPHIDPQQPVVLVHITAVLSAIRFAQSGIENHTQTRNILTLDPVSCHAPLSLNP